MNELTVFENEKFGAVRTMEINGKPYFMASDVAKGLGYARPNDAVNQHCRATVKYSIPISGKMQEVNFIPEGDLYRLISHSKLPEAEQYESWIFDEVLPCIRKYGAYMTPETLEAAILNPDMMIRLCTALKDEQDKNKALQAANSSLVVDSQIMKPKADYFDELVDRNLLTNFRDTAKQLHVPERKFIKFLLDKKYIYRDKRGKLKPYANKYEDLFDVKEFTNDKTGFSDTQTLITPKGRETFRLLLLKADI